MATSTQITQVTQLFTALFMRAPAVSGLNYYTGRLESGATLDEVAQEMYDTAPARTYYADGATPNEIVTSFFTNTLGRAPLQGGLDYWSLQLATKTQGQVIAEMILSVTNFVPTGDGSESDTQGTTSQSLFENKVTVGEYFATVLLATDATLAAAAYDLVTADPASVATANAANTTAVAATQPVTYTLAASSTSLVAEGGDVTFTVTPSTASDAAVTLYVQITGVTVGAITTQASAGDFSAVLLAVTIPAGSVTPVVVSTTVSADAATEGPEGFQAILLDSGFAAVSGVAAITGTITEGTSSGRTFTLTPNVDSGASFTGGIGDDTFNATPFTVADGTTVATLTSLDSLDGGDGADVFNIVDTTAALSVTSVTVKNIETANITAAGTVKADVSGWTGLTSAVVAQQGGNAGGSLTAAATTDVTLTDSAAAAATVDVQGGKNVTVTATGVTAAGTINVGTTTAVTGTVNVTASMSGTQTGTKTADAINVKGGTTVTVTANLSESSAAAATNSSTVTGGDIGVTGGAATTTVTVTQTGAVTERDAATAVTYVNAVTGVTAAPGQNGVTAVTKAGTTAATARAGVVDGKVTIADSTTSAVGTIKTVTLANYGTGSKITSNALTDLSLTGTAGTLALDRVAGSGASDTLNLTLNTLSTVASMGSDNTIKDTNNEIKTLNVTTATGNSTLTAFTDTGLTTLNVAGTHVLTLGTVNTTLTKIAVSGSAGFSGSVSGLGATLASFTTTSSGKITATLDAATQTFVGSTGQNVITIAADAKKVITGGSGSSDILVLNANATTFNADADKLTTKNVTGFEVLGTGTASQGTYDISTLPVGLKSIQMLGTAAAATSFTKVAAGATLAIDAAQTSAVTYQVADATGTKDTLGLTLGTSSTTAGFIVSDLTLKDANDVGLGTLSVVSQGSTFNTAHTITTLTDNGLSTLNVSGTAGLVITGLNQAATQATDFTINNTSSGAAGVVITTLTDANLGAVTFTGTGDSEITTLEGLSGKVLTLSNTGTGGATVGAIGTSGGSAGTTETNTVVINAGLAPGESATVAGRTVTNTSGTATLTATEVAVAMSGGAVAAGLTVSGALAAWTAAVTATNSIVLTSTTASSDVAAAVYSDTVRPAATAVAANVKVDGVGATSFESATWTMQGMTNGQTVTIDGLGLTAQRTLTATEVATAFAAIANGGATSAGNYTKVGAYADTAAWNDGTASTWAGVGAALSITDADAGAEKDETDIAITPTVSAAGAAVTDASVFESLKGVAVSAAAAQALTTITLTGDVMLGANDNTAPETAIGATTGVTVSGATNHAHVNLTLNGAAASATDTITLGNANNFITNNSTAGTVKITVGTGGNLIDVDAGAASTFAAEVTLGTHTNTSTVYNKILVSDTDGQTVGYSTVITGASTGDVIVFNNGADITWDAVTTGEQATITGAVNLAGAITAAFGTMGTANSATSFEYGGNTYIVQNEGADTANAVGTDAIVKLVGIHTVGDFGTVAGAVTIVS